MGAAHLPASQREHMLAGLNLLRLLVQGRTAEFHIELERIPLHLVRDGNPYIGHPVALEQRFMEGAYGAALGDLAAVAPAKQFAKLAEALASAARDAIAGGIEAAYGGSLALSDAARLLRLDEDKVDSFGMGRGWTLEGKMVTVGEAATVSGIDVCKGDVVASAQGLIDQTLTYAKELERII